MQGVVIMARGKKTNPETIYKIMASYAMTNNAEETAKLLKLPRSTVMNIIKKNKDKKEFVELGHKKKNEFADKASIIIDKALHRLENSIDNEDVPIPINHLTTVIGTLYDKRALAQGESTENSKIKIVVDYNE